MKPILCRPWEHVPGSAELEDLWYLKTIDGSLYASIVKNSIDYSVNVFPGGYYFAIEKQNWQRSYAVTLQAAQQQVIQMLGCPVKIIDKLKPFL